ncbi:hypothetical protein V9T40_007228 [Parthenolecanium corni]|uniref:Dynein light chain Tctex-type 1 n=1 Tax=Parthenolecanium corni TaxID=536013 RepID=A0AAN9TUK3_9HEMI
MDEGDEQNLFVVDEVSSIIKQAIEDTIGGNTYQQNKVNMWTTQVVDTVLQSLAKLNKPFKYIVTSTIMQKNGAGLHSASSCFWDNNTDGSCTVRWENKTMILRLTGHMGSATSHHLSPIEVDHPAAASLADEQDELDHGGIQVDLKPCKELVFVMVSVP